ncbi:isocitrate lyase, partial [Bacillus thuringiensis]|nr:isocitrate lyase [Bacillus thuringiensis]
AVRNLISARRAADVRGVLTMIVARTEADAEEGITSESEQGEKEGSTGERTPEGWDRTKAGLDQEMARGLAYAPYAELVWCETSEPNLEDAKRFADAIHKEHTG